MAEKTEKIEQVFSGVNDITSLAHFARCQAHEADLRATHALLLADRAVEESRAVRGIADSLSKTARVVAKLALENMATIDASSVINNPMASDSNSTATASQTDLETSPEEEIKRPKENELVLEDIEESNTDDSCTDGDVGSASCQQTKDKDADGSTTPKPVTPDATDSKSPKSKRSKEHNEENAKSEPKKESSTLDNINALLVKARELGIGSSASEGETRAESASQATGVKPIDTDQSSGDVSEDVTKKTTCSDTEACKDRLKKPIE